MVVQNIVKIGFLGAGKIAQALAKGFVEAGVSKGNSMIVSCAPNDESSVNAFENLGSSVTFNNAEVVTHTDVLILAVKPTVVPIVLSDIKPVMNNKKLLLSSAMGTSIEFLEKRLPAETKVVRIMPNTPSIVRHAASVFSCGSYVTEQDVNLTKMLLKSIGTCDEIPEFLFDPVTALSGSGPAYVYVLIEAMADGAVRMGIPRDLAYKLAAQTVAGAGHMVLQSSKHPAELKDDVTSPAGSTAEGLYCLESSGLRAAMIKALEFATNKCRSMTAQM